MIGRDVSGLPLLRNAHQHVARDTGGLITRIRFLGEIEHLAGELPDRPHVVNLCADRYRFTVAWAAAMLRGQVTLLPSSHDAGAVAALRADYPALYVLSDDDGATDPPWLHFAYPEHLGSGPGDRIPAFPADQVAAVLFTSGSTGRPAPSVRRWGRLVHGSLAAGAALGVAQYPQAAVVATVPHAHSYGLESAVMLPLQHGLLLTAERPFFPTDVAAALGGATQPGVLITTPVHLRALVGDAETGPGDTDIQHPKAGFVLSATAPLAAELAGRAETTFGASVFEIYGCSEAGQLATRRTIQGPGWRCLDGFRLRQDTAGTWACGPAEADTLLADEIELAGDGEFLLRGRTADMVNVAGKRSSLGYLTGQLLAIAGVVDGVFLARDDNQAGMSPDGQAGVSPDGQASVSPDGQAGVSPRLAAIAVAPGKDAATILAALRLRIDAAFLPRPLHLVETLPRDGLGKLPRTELLRLLGSPAASPLLLRFPSDHPAARGHFPGNPIIPGAVLLDELVGVLFPNGWSGVFEAVKFHHPVRPNDTVAVTRRAAGAVTRVECRLAGSDTLVLSGALRPSSLSL